MKKRTFPLALLLCLSHWLLAQTYSKQPNRVPVLDSTSIKPYVAHFTLKVGLLAGKGAALLTEKIKASQFLVLGERHNSQQTSALTKALLPHLKKAGFQHFALEVGPHTVTELAALSADPDRTKKRLRAFNTKYYLASIEAYPIPFFFGEEDATFLAEASRLGFKLWGLDQEFFNAITFLTDKLLSLAAGKPDFKETAKRKLQADKQVRMHLIKGKETEGYATLDLLEKDSAVTAFFRSFTVQDTQAQQVIKDLKVSWDIYNRWRDGSHQDRISYMRSNFLNNYKAAAEKQPKVFVKVGQVHAAEQESNGAYDIGNLTEEIARANRTRSTSMNCLPRFYTAKDGTTTDYLHHPYFSRLTLFLSHGTKNDWALLNLEGIRKDLAKGKVSLPAGGEYHELRRQIENYDLLLVLPQDTYITPNLDKVK